MALTLAFDIVLCNLDTISGVSVHQTFKVTGHKLQFDESYVPSVSRTFMGDSREKVSEAIGNTINMLQELIQSYQLNIYVTGKQVLSSEQWDIVRTIKIQVKQIIDRKSGVLDGLNRLSDFKRYTDDKEFKLKINRFKTKFENIVEKIKEELLPLLKVRILEKTEEPMTESKDDSTSPKSQENDNPPTPPPPPTGFRLSPHASEFYSPQASASQPQTILTTFKNMSLIK